MPDYLETGFFAKVGAWHGKGIVTTARLSADEAYKQSGQDFTVIPSPIWVNGKEVKTHVATVRQDTSAVLGVVGNRYKIIQNKSLYDILAPVIDEMGAIYETGGVLKGGAVVWALAKLEKSNYVIGKEDLVNSYILLAMAHDGSMPLIATPTGIRVVCWNTLNMALNFARNANQMMVRIKHQSDAQLYINTAHKLLGLASANSELASAFFARLATKPVTSPVVDAFVAAMFPSKKEEEGYPAGVTVERARATVKMGFDSQINNIDPTIRHTGWSLYNSFTDYIDHQRPTRSGGDRRFYSWFGNGQNQRRDAVNWLAQNLFNRNVEIVG